MDLRGGEARPMPLPSRARAPPAPAMCSIASHSLRLRFTRSVTGMYCAACLPESAPFAVFAFAFDYTYTGSLRTISLALSRASRSVSSSSGRTSHLAPRVLSLSLRLELALRCNIPASNPGCVRIALRDSACTNTCSSNEYPPVTDRLP